jgi:hypothetical protein
MPFGTIIIASLDLSLPLPAVGTIGKLLLKDPATLAALRRRAAEGARCICLLHSRRHRLPAPATVKEWLALLDSQQGDKKQADVVIHLLGIRLIQAASGTAPGRAVQNPGLGLNARDKKTHRAFLGSCVSAILDERYLAASTEQVSRSKQRELAHALDLYCKWGIYFIKINL